jgi:hypothetical protein
LVITNGSAPEVARLSVGNDTSTKKKVVKEQKQRKKQQEGEACNRDDRHRRRLFVNQSSRKGVGREVRVIMESIALFEKRLMHHQELLPVWLPPEHVLLETPNVKELREHFQVDLEILLSLVSSHCTTAAQRIEKFSRKEEWSHVRRVLAKLFRILLLGLQMARHGRIVDYRCLPELGRLVGGFCGPEIMALSDERDARVLPHDGDDGVETSSSHSAERLQWTVHPDRQWKSAVRPLLEQLQEACTAKLQLLHPTQEETNGVPKATRIDRVGPLLSRFPPAKVISQLMELQDKYQDIQSSLRARRSQISASRFHFVLEAANGQFDVCSAAEEEGAAKHANQPGYRHFTEHGKYSS